MLSRARRLGVRKSLEKKEKRNSWNKIFEGFAKSLGLQNLDDWYNVTKEQLNKLEDYYPVRRKSLPRCLCLAYPEHDWKVWKFKQVPVFYWNEFKNRKKFFDSLAAELHITQLEDWYEITIHTIVKHGGSALLLKYYENSPAKALQSVYPHHCWHIWRFRKVSKGFWLIRENQIHFVKWLGEKLHIREMEDWYRVSIHHIAKVAPLTGVNQIGFVKLLQIAYPNHIWDEKRLSMSSIKASQRFLCALLQKIFPQYGSFLSCKGV
jgi:hypothetical protein